MDQKSLNKVIKFIEGYIVKIGLFSIMYTMFKRGK